MAQIPVKFFKVLNPPSEPAVANAVYFVKSEIDGTVVWHVTDQDGNLEEPGNPDFVLSVVAPLLVKTNTAPVLLSSTTVDLNDDTAKQSLFTVPSSRRAIVTRVDIDKLSADPGVAEFTMGWDSLASDCLDPFLLSDLVPLATKFGSILVQPTSWLVGTAGQALGLKVTTEQGSTLTAKVNVFGYLTDANGVPVANIL